VTTEGEDTGDINCNGEDIRVKIGRLLNNDVARGGN
jgi:hypothetical protein